MADHCSYRPLLTASLALDYRLAGGLDNLFWFHLSTFLTFLVQLVLMAELFTRLLERSLPSPLNRPLACFVTLWYGVHPVNAETVNYVIQRGDVQATLGVVAGLWLFVAYPRARRLGLFLLPVVVGALCKPSAIMFAPLLGAYLMLYEEDGSWPRRVWGATRRALPALVVCLALYALQEHFTGQHRFGGTSLPRHLLSQPWFAWHYVLSAVLPTELVADSDAEAFKNVLCTEALTGYLVVSLGVALAIFCARRRPLWPVAYGVAWFFLALAPTSLVPLAEVTNDHRMYFPYVGLMLAVSGGLRQLPELWLRRLLPLAVLLLLAYGFGTHQRNRVWHSEESLWRDVVAKCPRHGRGLMNYGLTRLNAGHPEEALELYERALPYLPLYSPLQLNLAAARDRLRLPGVEEHYQRALQLDQLNADPHYYYGSWLQAQGRLEESAARLEEGLRKKPDHLESLYKLLDVYYQQKNWDALERLVTQVRARLPEDRLAAAMSMRLLAHRERRFPVEVRPDLQEALELSYVLFESQAYTEAVRAGEYALQLDPRSAPAYNNIAVAKGALGDHQGAAEAARRALEIDPNFTLAKANLEQALRKLRPRP